MNIVWPQLSNYLSTSDLNSDFYKIQSHNLNFGVDNVNIGGGPFNIKNWINLDSSFSSDNQVPFYLTDTCIIPIKSNTIKLCYSSHCFEHLDDFVINNLINESKRILLSDSYFLIQIPNFDLGLKFWQNNDPFFVKSLGVDIITPSWKNRSVNITVNNMCSTLFCAFWNSEYGNHYSNNRNFSFPGYHGCPIISDQIYKDLILKSPNYISNFLVSKTLEQEDINKISFNHRNGWSNSEFINLFTKYDFEFITSDYNLLKSNFSSIPFFDKRYLSSSFFLFKSI